MSRHAAITLILLTALASLGAGLSIFVAQHSLALVDGPWVTLLVDDQPYSLLIGIIPLNLICLILSLFALFMIAELFGGKEAITGAIACGLVLFLSGLFLQIVPALPGTPEDAVWDSTLLPLLKLSLPLLLSQSLQIAVGFSFMMMVYELLRRATHGGFMIVRLFVASFLGLTLPPLIEAFFSGLLESGFGKLISFLITRYVQWNLIFFMLIPLYYLLYVPFGFLAGREQREQMKKRFQKKKIFQHEEKNFFEKREELQEKRIPDKKNLAAVGEGGG